MSFSKLGLSESINSAVIEKGYTKPSAIQEQAIPSILRQGDLMACAQTGTGKTAAFVLPILEMLSKTAQTKVSTPRALILTPTRELAAQIQESISGYGKNLKVSSTMVYGGVKIGKQIRRLSYVVDILVATPGRLLDLCAQGAVKLDQVEILVLDEADRMLDMGFIKDIRRILSKLPKKRQNLLFSATFSNDIRTFAKGLLHNCTEVNVSPKVTTAERVSHKIHPVDSSMKARLLGHLIKKNNWFQALVFSRTKHGANKLVKYLNHNEIQAQAIHGNKSQAQRTKTLSDFKAGKIQILVATDIAARGIDIQQLPQVINYDLPQVPEDYVHRIGRTGRAGASGEAISLVCAGEIKQLKDIEKVLKHAIAREEIEGFEPKHNLPTAAPKSTPKPRSKPSAKPRKKSHSRTFKQSTAPKKKYGNNKKAAAKRKAQHD